MPWEFQYTDWAKFDTNDAALLENAFANAPTEKLVTTDLTFNKGHSWTYEFDFQQMAQRNMDCGTTRNLRRKMLSGIAQWEFQYMKWAKFDTKDSTLLEDAFSTAPTKTFSTTDLTFNKGAGDFKYEFDFQDMTQLNVKTKKVRKLRRIADDTDAVQPAASANAEVRDYQWEWMDDTGVFVAFYDDDSAVIEKAYSKDPKSLFKTTGLSFNKKHQTLYVFDFKKMEQLNTKSNKRRKLRWGEKAKAWDMANYGTKATANSAGVGGLGFPTHWTRKHSDVDMVDIDLGSDEAKNVLSSFHSTIQQQVTVHSLQRIQNYALWPFYALTQKTIADQNNGEANEKMLFHGARVRANMDAITNFGFDMRVAANGSYGIGIYFAVNAAYSDHGYVLQNPDQSKEMFICRVTCGEHITGQKGLRRPPPKVPNGALYDSVTDTGNPNAMHVVFNNSQAYPEYLVKYT